MLSWLKRWLGFGGRGIKAPANRFDAARSGPESKNHWANADALSPNATANHADRKILRQRARYEVANNAFAHGAANAIAEDTIGSGPRLQLIGLPEKQTQGIESSWAAWADETGLAETLRLMYRAEVVDGESFALATDNPRLDHPVKLYLRSFEADRVTNPAAFLPNDRLADGIDFDAAGNPTQYTILRQHPGDQLTIQLMQWDEHPASVVYHLFRADRPGQARGISWLTPALHLFAQLRRYTLAVLTAAETAATIAGILKSQLPPSLDGSDPPTIETMDEIALPRGALLTAPAGWDVTQLKAEQPTSTFGDFRTQILVEIGRVLDMPLNRITGNSSGYNYSSGRLDHLGYHRSIWLYRERLRLIILDRLFRAWLDEAVLVGSLPRGLPPFSEWQWDWQWDAFGDIDPLKEASAAEKLLALNLTDLAEQCAARGRRWDQVLRQRARELALMNDLGLLPVQPPAQAQSATGTGTPRESPVDGSGPEAEPIGEEVASAR